MTASPFLTAQWRHLVMLNYEVKGAALRDYLPAGTELDRWHGTTFMSVVAFRFERTRVLGLPIPWHRDFEELNLRFYVRRKAPASEVRQGIVFIREIVPRLAVTVIARTLYNEPYRTLPMRSSIDPGPPPGARYEWRLGGRWDSCAARGAGAGTVPAPGSLEEFISVRHWGYTRRGDGATAEYRVDHPRWRLWPVTDLDLPADFNALYGKRLAGLLERPAATFIADGSAISVFPPARLDGAAHKAA